jgi:hypothetical protein
MFRSDYISVVLKAVYGKFGPQPLSILRDVNAVGVVEL